ncbi:MAG: Amuc_1102 family pilus-like protein [Chthoniobacterales bacterium]
MKPFAFLFAILLARAASPLSAQTRPPAEFQITKITKNLIPAPLFSYEGAQQYETDRRTLWLEVEVEFAAAPAWTDELTAKYFILLNGKLLTGEVTHVNVPAGRELRSVMYVTPRILAHFNGDRPLAANSIRNIAVQLVESGAVKSEANLERAAAGWFASVPPITGFVLNKNETPFAPLYWDRYEQIKSR